MIQELFLSEFSDFANQFSDGAKRLILSQSPH